MRTRRLSCGVALTCAALLVPGVWACPPDEESPEPSGSRFAPSAKSGGSRQVAPVLFAAELVKDEPADGKSGWLGVQLGEVPEPLAAQLGSDDQGVLVINIVTDSPADKAGIERYDLITEVDGDKVAAGDVAVLTEKVGAKGAGQSLKLVILRGGEERRLSVKLGQRPGEDGWNWKFEHAPEAQLQEQLHTKGRVLKKGPDGTWRIEDLEDWDALKDLPKDILESLPKFDGHSFKVYVDNDRKEISTTVERDGTSIEVTQKDGGPITVTRTTDEDGDTTTNTETYATPEALKDADEEAFDVYNDAQSSQTFVLDHNGKSWTFNLGDAHQKMDEWQRELQERIDEAQRSFDEAMKRLHDARGWWQQEAPRFDGRFRWSQRPRAQQAQPHDDDDDGPGFTIGIGDQPRQSFRVNPDGQIEARIRKGDSEVIKVFRDEDDMKKREPALFEAYSKVQADR